MCGILAALGLSGDVEANRRMLLRLSKLLRHRGPDSNKIDIMEEHGFYMCHERLNIVDTSDAGRFALSPPLPSLRLGGSDKQCELGSFRSARERRLRPLLCRRGARRLYLRLHTRLWRRSRSAPLIDL